MPCDIVVGLQYGDEGKGKIVDTLSENYDYVVRYQGGSNAGHTIYVHDQKYVVHSIPSGILNGKKSVITHGCVINPEELLKEIKTLENLGIDVKNNLFISEDVHITTHKHLLEDESNKKEFGSTGKGIGPTYRDKVIRKGLRLKDIINTHSELSPYMVNTRELLYDNLDKNILFEGAQAVGLDIDFGTYPYVTSVPCTANYVPQGSGLPLHSFSDSAIVGVVKAYMTRIAVGPFDTEMDEVTAEVLREKGKEYGATTGRPRRIGWLDLEQLSIACEINGITQIALTKVDVLTNLSSFILLKRIDGHFQEFFPWRYNEETVYDKLDSYLRYYVDFIEEQLNIPITMIGVGPNRDQIIFR